MNVGGLALPALAYHTPVQVVLYVPTSVTGLPCPFILGSELF